MTPGLEGDRLVFLDETAAKTNTARTHGYAPAGERPEGVAPYGRWQTAAFWGAMRADGFLAPLVMDNLACHKAGGVRAALEAAGRRLLYLPAYSPDLNPIELAFSKLKRLLRRAAERTAEGVWWRIGRLLDRFTAPECRIYLRHCGYAATSS